MNARWNIKIYETPAGDKPVEEFITSLPETAQTKIARTFDYLQEFGPSLGAPRLKKLIGTDLWELRILGSDSIRMFYVTQTHKTFLILHGFKKKTQKTPRREITRAQNRLAEFQARQHS